MMNVILLVMRCCQSGDVAFKNCDDYRVVLEHLRDLTQLRCILPHFVSTTQQKLMATLKHLTSLVTSSGSLLHFTDWFM